MNSFSRLASGLISQNIRRVPFLSKNFATTVSVKNLPLTVTTERVQQLLNELELDAPDTKIEIPLTKNGHAKGLALLDFEDDTIADLAIEAITGHEMQGLVLRASVRGEVIIPKLKKKTISEIESEVNEDDIDLITTLRIEMLKDKSREKQDEFLKNILEDNNKDENHVFELISSKKEKQMKLKAKADAIKYKDEKEEDRIIRVRAEAIEEEYLARCREASKALVRPPDSPELTDDMPGNWIESIVAVDRVQKIIKGGSIMSYRVLVVVGNAKGAGGFGVGKAADPGTATTRAVREAKKNIIVVDRYKNTALVHSVEGSHNSCRVVLRAVPPGRGGKAGKVVSTILEQMGIADFTGKAHGRRQPAAVVRATFKALARHTSLADISRSRGRRILDVQWQAGK
eukprot:CAMPEP_0114358844 /NCGR_PEP_ID=MMETSP0101-20121206/22570_1 /TAXON_ID=38822 ORGANISM="Pteridomonas danica, Strain PT" /NCGR_SAMPLE_ID=MMETSP0101 /ASSEMBLY_ACC=CAM_ASM_000211 /LENGTH=400 /DNA_ID=CAMNT_0001502087 /DNA_START=1 /DNA_END=1203 /DNA_ORIENTATION=+